MKTIDLIQGSPEWHAHRAQHFNASDAPAMMGCSPYQTRTELLTRMKTGISAEVDPATQRRFDDGHRFEALARPLAQEIIGEELYPVTGTNGQLSASFDGLTLMNDAAFEHKSLNDDVRAAFEQMQGVYEPDDCRLLPIYYRVQMEQQLLVAGAERVLFMASKWNGDTLLEARHCWYVSDPALRAKIIAGWEQFAKDLVEFVPAAAEAPKPTGKAPEALPALHIVIQGGVSASNLDEFKAVALTAIRSVNRDLKTDQDFADSAKARKWCEDIESKVEGAKNHALSQTASIDALFKTMDEISAEARLVRLELEKLEKARKDAIKGEIVAGGVAAFAKYIAELNAAMPGNYMPQIPSDFGGCIKNLRTVDSIRNAVDTELARAKVAASDVANLIHANVKTIKASGLVVHDAAALVLKQPDDLAAVIAQRVAAEKAKEEAQRERIRAEESARLEREAAAKAAAEKAEADRIAREQAEAAERMNPVLTAAVIPQSGVAYVNQGIQADGDSGMTITTPITPQQAASRILAACLPEVKQEDDGARMTLGQINAQIAPVRITVDGLALLGYEPVAVEKAARLYQASKFKAICQAISAHVLAANVKEAA